MPERNKVGSVAQRTREEMGHLRQFYLLSDFSEKKEAEVGLPERQEEAVGDRLLQCKGGNGAGLSRPG